MGHFCLRVKFESYFTKNRSLPAQFQAINRAFVKSKPWQWQLGNWMAPGLIGRRIVFREQGQVQIQIQIQTHKTGGFEWSKDKYRTITQIQIQKNSMARKLFGRWMVSEVRPALLPWSTTHSSAKVAALTTKSALQVQRKRFLRKIQLAKLFCMLT